MAPRTLTTYLMGVLRLDHWQIGHVHVPRPAHPRTAPQCVGPDPLTHNLGKLLFNRVNEHLASRGLKVAGGTIVDATIIAAPSSTKNEAKARDTEMHQGRVSSGISG